MRQLAQTLQAMSDPPSAPIARPRHEPACFIANAFPMPSQFSIVSSPCMNREDIGVTVRLHIAPASPADGGRTQSIVDGYRPLCIVRRPDGKEVLIGLCQLRLNSPIQPGESGEGMLNFAHAVTDAVKSNLHVGSEFDIAEGRHVVGVAQVMAIVDSVPGNGPSESVQ